jgi:hypothetical protein
METAPSGAVSGDTPEGLRVSRGPSAYGCGSRRGARGARGVPCGRYGCACACSRRRPVRLDELP